MQSDCIQKIQRHKPKPSNCTGGQDTCNFLNKQNNKKEALWDTTTSRSTGLGRGIPSFLSPPHINLQFSATLITGKAVTAPPPELPKYSLSQVHHFYPVHCSTPALTQPEDIRSDQEDVLSPTLATDGAMPGGIPLQRESALTVWPCLPGSARPQSSGTGGLQLGWSMIKGLELNMGVLPRERSTNPLDSSIRLNLAS